MASSLQYDVLAIQAMDSAREVLDKDADWNLEYRHNRAMLHLLEASALANLAVSEAIKDLMRLGLPVERVP